MPPWGRSLEYHFEPVIKQFNAPPLHIKSVQMHEMCLDTRGVPIWFFAEFQVIVISQCEYDILVITRVRGGAEDEC